MPRVALLSLLFAAMATGSNQASAEEAKTTDGAETKYVVFQVWPAMPAYPGIPPLPGRMALSKGQMAGFVQSVVKAIGTTGGARHKLGFAVGPFCFDISDAETRQWIRDAFAVARENDVAVAIHIDDSMSWGQRKDLLSNPDNIETADWRQIPNAARSLQWGVTPSKFPPQMCYNAPEIVAAAKDRAGLIGAEIKRELAVLKSQGKEHLFAAVIAGSETQISPEFGTNRRLGFRALAHRGFSEKKPPKDVDAERVSVVKEWIELWCHALHTAGVPREKIFCHIAFTSQGLRKPDAKESYAERVHFAPPEVAFSSACRPGFSTYPEGRTFEDIYAALAAHGSPGWISAEGTNVSPTSMPGEPTMETYLGRMFNHGAVLTNLFSWGIGGEAQRNNFFRKATENPECLAAYAKFLRGEKLVESAAQGFSASAFQEKMQKIQADLPGWMQKSELAQRLRAMTLMQELQSLMKERKWQELDKVADELLALMKGVPTETRKGESTVTERLPPKIQKIQKELPEWIGSDIDKKSRATALMKQLQEHLKAARFEEAEKTADSILKMMGAVFLSNVNAQSPIAPAEGVQQRIAAKVVRVTGGVRKWTASGRDPSPIAKIMDEKVKPLLATGKFSEAETELDRVLEELKQSTPTPTPRESLHNRIVRNGMDSANDANDIEYLVFMPPLPGAGPTPDLFSHSIQAFAAKLGTTGDGKTRQLGFGFGFPFFVSNEAEIRKAIKQGFDFAKQTNVAVHFLVDDHTKWDGRPDLWNWYDPAKKGFNPDNKKNVEWYDWEGTPSKRRYLSPVGLPQLSPHMCYNSPAILKEIRRIMSQLVGPALREEINKLKQEHREYLFAGITVGAEAGFDDYSVVPTVSQILSQSRTSDPMRLQMLKMLMAAAKLMEEDKAPHSRVGYCSLTNAGYSKTNPPADINAALAAVNQQFIEFWDKQFFDAGIPCSRIYTHVAACGPQDDFNNAPLRVVFNPYARPGWTTYPQSLLKNGFQPLYDELAKHGNPTWGGVEANAFGNPNAPVRASWEKYLAWHYNHGAKLVGINIGASDQWVMSYLGKGAFGGEAMAAYKKFLKGEQLSEK